jgi:hypothetical protein
MSGNISFSKKHQGASEEREEAQEVLEVVFKPIKELKANIEQIIPELSKYVENKPSNEVYSAMIHLEQSIKLLNN